MYVGIGVGVLAIIAVSVCLTYVIIVRRQKQSHNITFGGEQAGPQQPNLPLVQSPPFQSPQIPVDEDGYLESRQVRRSGNGGEYTSVYLGRSLMIG